MTERRTHDIGARLENWARAYRTQRQIEVSPTGKFCDQLQREAEGEKPTGERRKVDQTDAEAIERAMRDLSWRDRKMLTLCYIEQKRPEAVCRVLGLAHRPATVFVNAFRRAQDNLEQFLAF
ncbi:hypothetical protein [uncultured Massilia sp.]|uniref:hypothetical protein n=1 Tax=uncultured Massilia sp. TaxID=169973 RepID=UPI00258B9BF9|nr:hypothetical protein [uncultured Massilia sp.]